MGYIIRTGIVVSIFFLLTTSSLFAQSYSFKPIPDVWYNTVDGVRLGLQFKGAKITDFGEDDHRLNAGIWFGTNQPRNPISYFFSFTESISPISSYDNEANVEFLSSSRAGLSRHGVFFSKRFSSAFDESKHKKIVTGFSIERQFDFEYLIFQPFQRDWKALFTLGFEQYNVNNYGPYRLISRFRYNFNETSGRFARFESEANQQFEAGVFSIKARGFLGLISNFNAPEESFSLSFKPFIDWADDPITRARGTIPPVWLQIGNTHFAGGANLRGYVEQDAARLVTGGLVDRVLQSVASINLDVDFPNPVSNKLEQTSILKDVVQFRSYVFFDAGVAGKEGDNPTNDIRDTFQNPPPITPFPENAIFDGGVGFTLDVNIPDFQGNRRGFVIRYELPFWVSQPQLGDENFKFRQIIGFGGIFTF